jgi:poly(A) polymerase
VDDERSKQPCNENDALAVVQTLRRAGHVAYFAGGCVRDVLLGLQPKDYDVATDALPQQVRALFKNTQAAGQAFGVILVRLGSSVVEVATFRSDGTYTDGRRPDKVSFTNAEHDAQRRDFTINGLFLDPISGQIIDYVGGQEDLKQRILRAIGTPAERFGEDYLRMLRAVRFAARFDLTIEPATESAIQQHAARLMQISPERIAEELRAMLPPPTRVRAYQLLWSLGLMPVIFRGLLNEGKVPSPGRLFVNLAPDEPIPFALGLAALAMEVFHSAPYRYAGSLLQIADIRRILQVLRFYLKISNDESDLVKMVLDLQPLLDQTQPTVARMKRFLAQTNSMEARKMLDAVRRTYPEITRIAWLQEQFASLEKQSVAPKPLLNGDELVAAGYRPGPLFKKVLDEVYDAQLEDRINSKEEAMAMARQQLGSP